MPRARGDAARARLAEIEREIELARARNAALRERVESIEPHQAADVIEDVAGGEENYLLGLKVEGRRIAILIDRSASMTDERLIDIIARKVRTDAEKRKGPKWRRTLRTARWLLHRLPAGSEVAVIAFNDEAKMLHREGWADGRDRATLQALFDELDRLVPTGATNLEAGLRALGRLSPEATDIYVVTDGLPTRSLSSPGLLSGCSKNPRGKVRGGAASCCSPRACATRHRRRGGRCMSSCCRWKAIRRRRRRSGTGRRGPEGCC